MTGWQEGKSTYKVNTDGGNVRLGVGVIGKSQQQTRLSNTGITDEEELEEVVVSRIGEEACQLMVSPLQQAAVVKTISPSPDCAEQDWTRCNDGDDAADRQKLLCTLLCGDG